MRTLETSFRALRYHVRRRRIIGVSHVHELESIDDADRRAACEVCARASVCTLRTVVHSAQRRALRTARRLLLKHTELSIADVVAVVREVLATG